MPAALPIFGIILYPVIYNLYLSLFKVGLGGISDRKWIGLQNFKDVLNSKLFWDILGNTGIWVVGITVFIQLIALFSAILLNQKIRGRGIYRGMLLLPWVIPGVVTGILWKYMFDSQFGVVNDILLHLGLIKDYVPWLSQTSTSLIAVMITFIWKLFPLSMIMILGRLQGIPDEIYEAAAVDGVGPFQLFRYIIMPLLKNVMTMTTVFMIILSFNSFDLTYIMTGGGPIHSSEIIGMYIYNLGFTHFNIGGAATTASLVLIMSLGMIFLYVRNQSREKGK